MSISITQRRGAMLGMLAALPAMNLVAQARVAPPRIATLAQVIARGDSLQLAGAWTPPPGDALSHQTAGFAVTLCGAVFITGLSVADAAANVGFFIGPLAPRADVVDTVVDRATQTVRLRLRNGVTRVAKRYGSQGCIPLPIGADSVSFTPSVVTSALPPAATTAWPMGDVLPDAPLPREIDATLLQQAMDEGFGSPDAMTLAFVVTYKGRIIGERYAAGIGIHTPLESWSMGKSLTGTLVARLIQLGTYTLDQPAPFPQWQQPGDPRQKIRIMDLMRMSSGLRLGAPYDPGFDAAAGYPDHLYLYTGSVNSFEYAANRPQQWQPGTVGRYRNTDPVLASYLVRLGAERRGVDYHAFPTRELFDRIGMRDVVIYTDPFGNYLGQGAEVIAARDWARLGNLYLQDGVWNGERLLPRGYVRYVRTIAPAWLADGRPVYGGGFFWINGDGAQPMPRDAYAMLGAGGQSAWIVPSHDLVIVRIGKYRGEQLGEAARAKGTATLLRAIRR
jgi:CubicO group peptidase (beta-lactamase class C family)